MRNFLGAGLAMLALLTACGGDGGTSQPQPGDLLVAYQAGSPEAGAVVLTISGGPVQKVTAISGQQVSFASPYTGTTRVVVLGTLASGDLLKIRVPDVKLSSSYAVRTDQVADNVTFALLEPAGYTFSVHR